MALSYNFTDELKAIFEKLRKKDPKRLEIIHKKVRQIIASDEQTIEHYKNLKHHLKRQKRVHIDSNFVLTFSYDREKKFILFIDFDHHDNIYER
ncbi:MAG: addiction module toxin RelE [Candidatus Micrarchaeota archaeon]|nr:addiction module toxin RelE [Candidatus Micrarchaeota archaeon]